ncbi:hypothetical protein GF382_01595 [Candidatus Falkowbacteria bacterium]|nr:hypothetical protein [Candidatus Falkowbacteria bacterium]
MKKYIYLLVFITPISVLLLLEALLIRPRSFWYLIAAALFISIISILMFAKAGRRKEAWWNLLILPMLMIFSLAIYASLIVNQAIIHVLFIFILFFLYHYLNNSYYFLIKPDKYEKSFLENISSYGGFLAFFFAASSAYAVKTLLGIPLWIPAISMFLIILAVLYQNVWVNKATFKQKFIYVLIPALILMEIAIAIYFFPFNHNTLGLILAICYYIIIGLVRVFLRNTPNRRSIKLYLLFGFLSILIILFTTKWI